jgi:hypothetical protein
MPSNSNPAEHSLKCENRRPPSHLTHEQICTVLISALETIIGNNDDGRQEVIRQRLWKLFHQWKEELGSRSPAGWRNDSGVDCKKTVAFEEAAPYECTNINSAVSDYVTLVLYLVRIKYPAAKELLEEYDLDSLIAVSALLSPKTTQLDSIFLAIEAALKLADFDAHKTRDQLISGLTLLVKTLPDTRIALKTKSNLATGRKKGTEKRAVDAKAMRFEWRTYAVSRIYGFGEQPKQIADAIANNTRMNPEQRSVRTIYDAIKGCKAEANLLRKA